MNWQSLGNFTVTGTQLKVTVANTATDGQVCADAVRILPAYQPTEIVNNGYPGSWSVRPAGPPSTKGLYGDALVSNTRQRQRGEPGGLVVPLPAGPVRGRRHLAARQPAIPRASASTFTTP